MAYVLAIEAHPRQANILREIVGLKAQTKLTLVDSLDAALAAIADEVPRLVLASALMPPREEAVLLSRLRDLPRDRVPQILVIPALAAFETPPSEPRRSLFTLTRKRRLPPEDCDPSAFADQLSAYLNQAERRLYDAWEPQPQSLRFMPGTSGVDRRTALRFERVRWAGARVNGIAVGLVDLSATGAQVLASIALAPGESVHVVLSREADAFQLEAAIVWGDDSGARSNAQAAGSRVGMNFKDFDTDTFERFYFGQN
jgi:hypothetical protein